MNKWEEKRTMGPKHIKCWKCKDDMLVEYEELDAEKGTVDGEWRQYKDAFDGWRRSCVVERREKGGTPRCRNQ